MSETHASLPATDAATLRRLLGFLEVKVVRGQLSSRDVEDLARILDLRVTPDKRPGRMHLELANLGGRVHEVEGGEPHEYQSGGHAVRFASREEAQVVLPRLHELVPITEVRQGETEAGWEMLLVVTALPLDPEFSEQAQLLRAAVEPAGGSYRGTQLV